MLLTDKDGNTLVVNDIGSKKKINEYLGKELTHWTVKSDFKMELFKS